MSSSPILVLVAAVVAFGCLVYLGGRLFVPLASGAVADLRRRTIAWPSVLLVVAAVVLWLGLMTAVIVGGVHAADAL